MRSIRDIANPLQLEGNGLKHGWLTLVTSILTYACFAACVAISTTGIGRAKPVKIFVGSMGYLRLYDVMPAMRRVKLSGQQD